MHAKNELDTHLLANDLDLFIVEEPDVPDQFMSIKPWKGAICAPTVEPHIDTSPPDVSYEIDFVHGYKSDVAIQNLYYNNKKEPIYMTAALGVILDTKNRTQKIFGGGEKGHGPALKENSLNRSRSNISLTS